MTGHEIAITEAKSTITESAEVDEATKAAAIQIIDEIAETVTFKTGTYGKSDLLSVVQSILTEDGGEFCKGSFAYGLYEAVK